MIVVKKVFICETIEGEQREIPIEVPVVSTDRKQADDKASFGSQSSGLAYLMRDLLLIPRGDKFVDIDGTPKTEVCSEDDTKYVKTKAPKKTATKADFDRPNAMKLIKSHQDVKTAFDDDGENGKPSWTDKILKHFDVKSLEELSDGQLGRIVNKITKEKLSDKSNN